MKKLFCFLTVLLTSTFLWAQKSQVKSADNLFEKFQYVAAAEAYEKAIHSSPENIQAKERLAMCYVKINNADKAEQWLAEVCKNPKADPQYVKMYAETLAKNAKYKESAEWYSKYSSSSEDARSKKKVDSYNQIHLFYRDSFRYEMTKPSFNSSQSDFGAVFFKNGIVFCSARSNKKNKSTFKWNNSSFIDLYQIADSASAPSEFSKILNSELHEGPATFNATEDTIYFTRNNFIQNKKGNSSDGVIKLKIYYSANKNGSWSREKEFELNNDEYSIGHPSLRGNKMYFTSDMPGGHGGTDIYVTQFSGGHWSAPINLGAEINTPGNEMFPFISPEGDLYFTSNGHPGLGGLDVFEAKRSGENFSRIENPGFPINSSKDDFGFIIKNNEGYFSSNRGDDFKDDNIYKFRVNSLRLLNIIVVGSGNKKMDGVDFSIENKQDQVKFTPQVNNEGYYPTVLNYTQTYTFNLQKKGYDTKTLILEPSEFAKFKNHDTLKIELTESGKIVFVDLLSESGKRLEGGYIEFKDLIENTTEKFAVSKDSMVAIRVTKGQSFELKGTKQGFEAKTIQFLGDPFSTLSEAKPLKLILSKASLFEENAIGTMIEMEIRYDKSKWNIRKDAAKELDRLVAYLKRNPNIKVELGSHTDSRGTEEANEVLSQKRADSAVRYLEAKGIGKDRLVSKGYGEYVLKVFDAKTEIQHEENRRTTVKIVGN